MALTFFAFLGFGIITFTAKDLAQPSRQLPRAMYLALGIATVIYVAIALGVFGTLTVEKVIASGGTALAVAAQPTLGQAGYWLMSVTALFATAGATNAGLYPAPGLSERLAETGQFPPLMARRLGGRLSAGLLFRRSRAWSSPSLFNLDAIASIGSAVALLIFTLITAAHFRVRSETGANALVLRARDRGGRGGPGDVRVHDPHPRARLDRRAAGRSRAQHRSRPVVETGPRRPDSGGTASDVAGRELGHSGAEMTTVEHPAQDAAWYNLSAEDAAARMGVDPEQGLAADEVQRRLAQYGPNELPTEPPPSCGRSRGASCRTR